VASVSTIRDGLKARLATIPGLYEYDIVPDDIVTPAAVVLPGDPLIVFDSTFARGSDEFNFLILVLVQYANERTAQDQLDGFLAGSGTSSVKTAIEGGGGTLGGVVACVTVTAAGSYGAREYAGVQYLGVEFSVVVGA
jgi:hypothetical protein